MLPLVLLPHEGRVATVTRRWQWDAMGVRRRSVSFFARTNGDARTVKSRGPDTPMLVSALMRKHHAQWWPTSPAHQGDREAAVKTVAQGRPGDSGCTCGSCRLHFFRRRATGVSGRPAFPVPSVSKRANQTNSSDAISAARRRCHVRSRVHGDLLWSDPLCRDRPSRRLPTVVIARESGRSSTPRPFGSPAAVSTYWVARSSRATTPGLGNDVLSQSTCHRWQNHRTMVTLPRRGCDARPEPTYPRGLIDP